MKNRGLLASTIARLLSACTSLASPTAPGEETHPCRDGICRGPEKSRYCSADCPSGTSAPWQRGTVAEGDQPGEYWITNPASGSRLYVRIITSETGDGAASPTLVLVPGGIGDGTAFTGERNDAQQLAEQGFTVVVFDPDGRGHSDGEEDKNGHTHGCLPGAPGAGSIEFMSDCDDEAFWSQREAEAFIAQINQYYQRIQSERDHDRPDPSSAIEMVNAAVEGGVPWVRLNDLPIIQSYDVSSLPSVLPESTDRHLASRMAE